MTFITSVGRWTGTIRPDMDFLKTVTGKVISAGEYSIASQVITQAKAVGVTILWTAVVAWVAYLIANMIVGLRVSEEEEREGLDVRSHGETAYHT